MGYDYREHILACTQGNLPFQVAIESQARFIRPRRSAFASSWNWTLTTIFLYSWSDLSCLSAVNSKRPAAIYGDPYRHSRPLRSHIWR